MPPKKRYSSHKNLKKLTTEFKTINASQYAPEGEYPDADGDDEYGELTPFQHAAMLNDLPRIKDLCAQYSPQQKAEKINENNYYRFNPLLIASERGNWDLVTYLITEHGALIDNFTTNKNHINVLYHACYIQNKNLITTILAHGGNLNTCYDAQRLFPIHIAICNGASEDFISFLLQHGADPNIPRDKQTLCGPTYHKNDYDDDDDDERDTALDMAILYGAIDLIPILKKYGARPTSISSQSESRYGLAAIVASSPCPDQSLTIALSMTFIHPITNHIEQYYGRDALILAFYQCLLVDLTRAMTVFGMLLKYNNQHKFDAMNATICVTWVYLDQLFQGDNQSERDRKFRILMGPNYDGSTEVEFSVLDFAYIANIQQFFSILSPLAKQEIRNNAIALAKKLGY